MDKINTTKNYCYTLEEIASWQKDVGFNNHISNKEFEVSLPSLQRGFVWKPHQIESLWDSILRGYPVGAVLMSQSGNKKELLDGQQRCTSIALGFINPLKPSSTQEIFNLKKNIPVVWLDMRALDYSKHGLKFGVRVLTRSHPWGYQLNDHRQVLSVGEREKALKCFREIANDSNLSFSALPTNLISPWDAYYPVPLSVLIEFYTPNYSVWKSVILDYLRAELTQLKTRYSNGVPVNYDDLSDSDFEVVHKAIGRAKCLLIPEILVQKETLEEDDSQEESGDATLFIRLNSEGTRISGEELIYSLLKATYPEAKELVENIGIKYIAPSKIVNLFARLSFIESTGFSSYQNEMNVASFRKNIRDQHFEQVFKRYIFNKEGDLSEAKLLMENVISILSLNKSIPNIYIKEVASKSLDLLLVLMVYLVKNKFLSNTEKDRLHRDFHRLVIFNTEIKNTSRRLFDALHKRGFTDWSGALQDVYDFNYDLTYPLLHPDKFRLFQDYVLQEYLSNRNAHFSNFDFLRNILSRNIDDASCMFMLYEKDEFTSDEDFLNRQLDNATNYWKHLSETIYWNRNLLVLVQREYFNREFMEFMEFEGIQDTNRPWDWDHIYPNSWVYSKQGISILVRWLVNTNGNFRALSFNENRSQSNHESPEFRFNNKIKAQEDSFIKDSDLNYWLQLTNDDNRLQEHSDVRDPKVDVFVKAVFSRMTNMYEEVYSLFGLFV